MFPGCMPADRYCPTLDLTRLGRSEVIENLVLNLQAALVAVFSTMARMLHSAKRKAMDTCRVSNSAGHVGLEN